MKYILLILLGITVASCIEHTTCPAYPTSELTWIPYELKDSMIFTDNENKYNFNIDVIYRSEEYSFWNLENDLCEAEANAQTNLNLDAHFQIVAFSYVNEFERTYEYHFYVYNEDNTDLFNTFFFRFDVRPEISNATLINEYEINGVTYENVLEIENSKIGLNNNSDVYGIIVAENYGVIEIRTIGKNYYIKEKSE